jgi:hypothetical protein
MPPPVTMVMSRHTMFSSAVPSASRKSDSAASASVTRHTA